MILMIQGSILAGIIGRYLYQDGNMSYSWKFDNFGCIWYVEG